MQPSASRRGRSITKAEQSAGTTGSSKFLGLVGTPRGNQKTGSASARTPCLSGSMTHVLLNISLGMLSKYRPRRFKRAPSRFNIRLAGISSVLVTLLCPPAAKFGGSWGHAYLRQNWKNRSHYAQGPKVRSRSYASLPSFLLTNKRDLRRTPGSLKGNLG